MRPKGPFSGLLIIDMPHVVAGPFGTNIFNDLGAHVIEIAADLGQMPGNVVIICPRRAAERQSPVAGFDRTHARIASLINEQ